MISDDKDNEYVKKAQKLIDKYNEKKEKERISALKKAEKKEKNKKTEEKVEEKPDEIINNGDDKHQEEKPIEETNSEKIEE